MKDFFIVLGYSAAKVLHGKKGTNDAIGWKTNLLVQLSILLLILTLFFPVSAILIPGVEVPTIFYFVTSILFFWRTDNVFKPKGKHISVYKNLSKKKKNIYAISGILLPFIMVLTAVISAKITILFLQN